MNTRPTPLLAVAAALLAAMLFATGCATAPQRDLALERVRSSLDELRNNPDLGDKAPVALNEAEQAVSAAEKAEKADARAHLVYLAERRVAIARARAEEAQAREEINDLEKLRQEVLMEARIREAERARQAAERARMLAEARAEDAARARREAEEARRRQEELAEEARQARQEADAARSAAQARAQEAELARKEAQALQQRVSELQSRLTELDARETERGVVVTVKDVLFEVGEAELKPGAINNLGVLVDFLQAYPDREIRVEGHTDSTGNKQFNLELSRERAASVRDLLVARGVDASRVSIAGMGENYPVASNDTAAGRQQNRRVEIVLLKPGVSPDTPPAGAAASNP